MADDGWRLGHRPGLDGLRGIAVLLVLLDHGHVGPFDHGGGRAGVTLFFALSGFLITALLVEEHRRCGRVDLRAFYMRRVVRLLPALVALVVFAVAVGWVTLRQAVLAMSYVGNWHQAEGGDMGLLSHSWSLAIEEQFYVLFPAAFILLVRWPRACLWTLGALALGSAVLRAQMWSVGFSGTRLYHGSDTRADAILLGCALGFWYATGRGWRLPRWAGVVGAVGLSAVALSAFLDFFYFGAALAAVSSVAVIAAVVQVTSAPRPLEWSPLRRLGRLSYGLYLWHVPIFWWIEAEQRAPLHGWSAALAFAMSVLAAEASMRLVEAPALTLKRRWTAPYAPSMDSSRCNSRRISAEHSRVARAI